MIRDFNFCILIFNENIHFEDIRKGGRRKSTQLLEGNHGRVISRFVENCLVKNNYGGLQSIYAHLGLCFKFN